MNVAQGSSTTLDESGITGLTAIAIAQRVRSKELAPVDVIRAHLDRINIVQPRLCGLTVVRNEQALREAEELSRRDDLHTLPLAGVPVAIKENLDVAGLPTTYGTLAAARTLATADDELVTRLRNAGCIVVAKSRMPELAIWPVSEGPDGAARNPYDPTRSPGGSSGGSAVAVATGMAALAVGSDGGGSIRIPAACCGIVGVKTTPGLVPLPGRARSHWFGLSVAGPMARNVADAALMLDVLAGATRFSPTAPPSGPVRIVMSTRHPVLGAPVVGDMRAAVDAVGRVLERLGHRVSDADPPYPLLAHAFVRCFMAGIAEDMTTLDLNAQWLERRTKKLARNGSFLIDRGLAKPASHYHDAHVLRRWIAEHGVLVAPIVAAPPPQIGAWRSWGWMRTLLTAARWMGFTAPWNLAGCPAIAVPAAWTGDGIPIGVQLVGAPGSERLLLGLAAQIEAELPQPRRIDPVSTT